MCIRDRDGVGKSFKKNADGLLYIGEYWQNQLCSQSVSYTHLFKKLPTIKALNTEYAELLAEKKAAYADYRKVREEMKELLTAKANIDRILELDKEQEEANERREKETEQR